MLTSLIHLIEVFEQNRKDDQRTLTSEVKKLFHEQGNMLDQLRQQDKQGVSQSMMESYESEKMRSREVELRQLKDKMSHF